MGELTWERLKKLRDELEAAMPKAPGWGKVEYLRRFFPHRRYYPYRRSNEVWIRSYKARVYPVVWHPLGDHDTIHNPPHIPDQFEYLAYERRCMSIAEELTKGR